MIGRKGLSNYYFLMSFPRFSCHYFFYCSFLLSAAAIFAGQAPVPVRPRPVDIRPSLNRVLDLNIEKSEEAARSSLLLESLERTLNALQPSLIMGFSHLADETPLSISQTTLFLEVRQKVLAANPRCKFAVTIHISNCLTPPALLAKLQEITTKLNPDVINMVVSSSNDVVSPTALARGIEYAHAHGALIAYEGPANMIPDGIDAFVMKTTNGEISRDEMNNFKMRHHLPVIVQFLSAPHGQDQKETFILSRLAEGQTSLGYHFAYPLQLTPSGNFTSNKDAAFLVMLRALLTRYN